MSNFAELIELLRTHRCSETSSIGVNNSQEIALKLQGERSVPESLTFPELPSREEHMRALHWIATSAI